MIRVGILGAESSIAGELIRILLHHPEVELGDLYSPEFSGSPVSKVHNGLIGESPLVFTDSVDLEKTDLLIVTSPKYDEVFKSILPADVKVIYIQDGDRFPLNSETDIINFVPGVSEMFRKPLVRGANLSRILSSYATVGLIVLYPLALHLLLNDTVSIRIGLPDFKRAGLDEESCRKEIETQLQKKQLSFTSLSNVQFEPLPSERALRVDIDFNCAVSKEEISRVFEEIYEDHNFTFLTETLPAGADVEGTQKTLIHIEKPTNENVHISAMADCVMRGGAGDAIHVLNLLFGLFEKTGLNLPASKAFKF